MAKSASYHESLIEDLKDPWEAASYIEVVLEEGDPRMLRKALKNLIEAQGGIEQLPLHIQQCYEKIDQMLFVKQEIDFFYLSSLLNSLGLQIGVKVKSA